ncbi:splicing factor C9orf78 [Centruroides vittatus]|uniref:splicing factor C9orf78 n=1 Tax=Centruroides vittatus TaxID=120091 RepID=UPI00350F4F31
MADGVEKDNDVKTEKQIKFKSKKKNLRRRTSSDSDEERESENFRSILEDAKEIRKLRKRCNGVSAIGLAFGKKLTTEEEMITEDPFKLKTGGMVNMKALKQGRTGIEELDAVNLGNTFSAETNRRDEDADMMKYIEEELAKRKGVENAEENDQDNKVMKPEDVLFEVPEHLRRSSSKKSEEMLSNQMLSGIPEVDLGIDERIRNIEATEEEKQKLLRERMIKKESGTSFVPTNMAVNFVQHNRFNIEETDIPKPKRQKKNRPQPVVVIGDADHSLGIADNIHKSKKAEDEEKATDDFHFEKFKKQFRRY